MVTVELAIGLITLTLLTGILSGIVLVGVAQASVARAGSEVARQLARGDRTAADRAVDEAPDGAKVTTRDVDGGVEVTLTAPFRLPALGTLTLESQAWARYETGAGP